MLKPKLNIVIDCETIDIQNKKGERFNKVICNWGYIVADNKCIPIEKKNILIKNIYNIPARYIVASYYLAKVQKTEGRKDTVFMNTFVDVYKDLEELFLKYKNTHDIDLWSYNADFDYSAFMNNILFTEKKNPFERNKEFEDYLDRNYFCIQAFAVDVLLNRPSYKEFCLNNAIWTDSLNYYTNAETAYKYVSRDLDFIEEHTALSDCECELEILKACKKQKKKHRQRRAGAIWQRLNNPILQMGKSWQGIAYLGHLANDIYNESLPKWFRGNNEVSKLRLRIEEQYRGA